MNNNGYKNSQYLNSTGQRRTSGSRSGAGASGQTRRVTERKREFTDPAYGMYDDVRRAKTQGQYRGSPQRSRNARKTVSGKKRRKTKAMSSFFSLDAIGCFGSVFIVAIVVLIIVLIVRFVGGGNGSEKENTPLTGHSGNISSTAPPETTPPVTEKTPETAPVTGKQEGDITVYDVPAVTFKADLSSYEGYMDPVDRDGFLILVNSKNLLSPDYVPKGLVPLDKSMLKTPDNDVQMSQNAAMALTALFTEMNANGYTDVKVTNAYRSYSYQTYIFGYWKEQEQKAHPDWTPEQVEKEVLTYSNREGTSEHQSGLCCDMHNLPETSWERAKEFADSPSGKWLIENCWKFGFVLRFPDGKQEECLGVRYESWHYRYVGRYHAYQMKMLGMCLEEYLEYIGK